MPSSSESRGVEADLLAHLRALEIELHRPLARRDATRLAQLLHADFIEFGRSGTVYTRAEIVAQLRDEVEDPAIVASDFQLRVLGASVALLTYRSARRAADGTLQRHTLRTSIWRADDAGWQMNFHQGTAIDA